MWNIYNNRDEVVDTADSMHEAHQVVTYLIGSDRQNAPFWCGVAA